MGDTHPDQAAGRQLADQQESGQAVVHLALEAPIPYPPLRYAVEDIEVDGTLIRRGDPTPVGFGAAGRDPAQHGDTAAKFDITRVAAPHLRLRHAPLPRRTAGPPRSQGGAPGAVRAVGLHGERISRPVTNPPGDHRPVLQYREQTVVGSHVPAPVSRTKTGPDSDSGGVPLLG
ncbi:hypothetical protein [Amycolatopsis sp. NPDC004169]|uniref:hypothetical protein n=1 Tax=Amycolatopsis sp. NPDC004169 TaxID=3154453 RepID=UPI0033B9DE88